MTLRPLLPDLQRLLDDTLALRDLRDAGDLDAPHAQQRLQDLRDAHDRLILAAPALTDRSDPITDDELHRALTCGALRLHHLRRTVLHTRPLIDTLGSQTLPHYTTDPAPHPDHLRDAFGLRDDPDMERTLQRELDALDARCTVMDALRDRFDLEAGGRAAAARLLTALYPRQHLQPDNLDLVATSTALLFCLPLERADDPDLDPDTRRFLTRCTRVEQHGLAFFPAFSPLRPHHPQDALLHHLADQTKLPERDLRRHLAAMLTALPRLEVDKYIVHDVWGHHWQAHLFAFEEAYQRIAAYADPPAPDLHLTPDAWRHLVLQRLNDTLIALTAEVIADAVEFKFNLAAPAPLPSSSFFAELPTKLDLTLADLPLYHRFATRGLHAAPTGHPALAALGTPDLLPCFALDPDGAPNHFTAHALAYLTFQAALNDLLRAPHTPVELALFTAAAFYEQHPARNLPRLAALILRLPDALRALPQGSNPQISAP